MNLKSVNTKIMKSLYTHLPASAMRNIRNASSSTERAKRKHGTTQSIRHGTGMKIKHMFSKHNEAKKV
jgi:hypothetical protein